MANPAPGIDCLAFSLAALSMTTTLLSFEDYLELVDYTGRQPLKTVIRITRILASDYEQLAPSPDP